MPLIFNIFFNNLFLFVGEAKFEKSTDDSTFYIGNKDLTKLLETLQNECGIALKWFENNAKIMI